MRSNQIRESFIKYFEERGHRIVPSAPVIPHDDPTLLFTNAGMNQFKDLFLGTGKRPYKRAADTQKCIRVSGKHNDLEEVGRDTYHHTFFEMLGNWSFGDYYKKEAISWAWELLTSVWGLDKKRLYVTVFESDDEAKGLWAEVTDIDPSHILRFGKKDNFWEMGETGPCGPCSEVHIDLTPDFSGGKLVNAGDPRVMEIWNLVFIQYDRDEKGNLAPLPAKHVDTGMGFERICAVLQGKKSNYDTDIFMPIIGRISEIANRPYGSRLDDPADIAMRVVADHARMLSFSIADGGIPSNEGRGYVMRRILRRGARFGRTLGLHEPFLFKVVDAVVKSMGDQFPEIREKQAHIERVIKGEEESFNQTLDRGLEIFERVIEGLGGSKSFPGEEAFKLYDTFGFPLDLTEMMASERGLKVEVGRFTELMEEQRVRARMVKVSEGLPSAEHFTTDKKSKFIGYDRTETEATVLELKQAEGAPEGGHSLDYVVLDETPFYAESGGQVGDKGFIEFTGLGRSSAVQKVFKSGDAIVHLIERAEGVRAGMKARLKVDSGARSHTMRNHTATHLLHEALRTLLGDHLHQQGSLVEPGRLRFDFNHFEKIRGEQLRAIEEMVNEKISLGLPVNAINDPADWLTVDEAKRRYPKLKMFFGEKYGDRVRVVEVKDFTWELCGGTHVRNTGEIGFFKIISESSIASGVRRIEAVTGDGVKAYIRERIRKTDELNSQIEKLLIENESLGKELGKEKLSGEAPPDRLPPLDAGILPAGELLRKIDSAFEVREKLIEALSRSNAELRKELSKFRLNGASSGLDAMVAGAVLDGGVRIVVSKVEVESVDELQILGDSLRSKLGSGVGILSALLGGKISLVCVVSDDLIRGKKLHAGKIVGDIAKIVGGGGGGRPHLATAGGKDIEKLDQALKDGIAIVKNYLK